jgi:hypothetical protein
VTFQRFSDIAPVAAHEPAALPEQDRPDLFTHIERMEQARRPEGYAEARWYTLLRDMRGFAEHRLDEALAAGWSLLDLFGSPPDTSARRWDLTGLVLMLDGREVGQITRDTITILNRLGDPNTFYRHAPGCSVPFNRNGAVLVWVAVANRSSVQ